MQGRRFPPSIEPVRQQFAIMTVSILLCAFVAFLFISALSMLPPLAKDLLGSVATLVLLLPFGYLLVAAPVSTSIIRGREAENTLRESEAKYRSLVELSQDLIAIYQEAQVVFINEAGAKLLGASNPEQIVGKLITDFIPDRYRETAAKRMADRLTQVRSAMYVQEFLRLDGTEFLAEVMGTPFSYHGEVAVQLVMRDLTEQKKAQRAVVESNTRLQRLADSFEGFIAYVRADTLKYEFVNETYATQFGLPKEQIVGKHVRDIIGDENYGFALKNIEEVRAGRSCSYENSFDFVSGRRWLQVNYFPVLDANGSVESIAVLNYDITERRRAEEETAKTHSLLEISQRLAHIGSWEYELSTKTSSWSDEMYRIAGLPIGSAINREIVESFFPPNELARSREVLSSVLEDHSPYSTDYQVKLRDGRSIFIHNEGEMIHDEDGKAIGIRGTTQDITARKQAEEELRQSQQIIEAMLSVIPAGVFWKDTNLVFLGCNKRFANDAGFDDPEEIVGRNDYEIGCPKELADAYCESDRRVMESGTALLSAEDVHIFGGKHVAHLTSVVPLRNSDGQTRGVLGTYVDITERRLAEEALKESEGNFRSIIEQSTEGIVVIHGSGTIAEWNPAQERITGLSRSAVIGLPAWEVRALSMPVDLRSPERIEEMKQRILRLLRGEQKLSADSSTEHPIVLPDGTKKVVSDHIFVIKKGSENRVVSIVSDITEKQKAESDKLIAEQYMQRAQRLESLGLLAGGIAHDFNNILTAIFGFMEMAKEETKDANVSDYLSHATRSLDRAKALTQQLLTFAKGGAPVRKVSALDDLLRDTALFVTSGSKVKCDVAIPTDLWYCSVDKNQIGQVIQNLLLNAIQAMPMGGSIDVQAENTVLDEHPTLKNGKYVVISVRDRGIGISQDMLPLIFDPFFTTKTQGHGLGLSITHSIVLRHDGAINVQSELGKGTTFLVYLPASDAHGAQDTEPGIRRHIGTGRVLVMDDEEEVRLLLSRMLQSFGYTVAAQESGTETIAVFMQETQAEKKFAAVILDLTIPGGIGGKEVAEAIRSVDREVPLFVASGYADDEVMANPQDYGFTASIAKPFRISDLSELLEKHLRNKP